MKTELFTVSKIFNETLFRIPDFQRGYSWGERQLRDFWTDVVQLAEDKSHYTGVITLEAVPADIWAKWDDDKWIITSRRYEPFYVVDGQQRLTTVSILLQCILEKSDNRELNYTEAEAIRKKYIFEKRNDQLARSYVFGYEKDNPSYEFLKTQIFNEESEHHSSKEETIYTRNLKVAKEFFLAKLSEFSHEDIEKIYMKVTQQLVFNVYEISREIDVFVAFETMNNRGKPLSVLELLKNRLIYLVMQMSDVEECDSASLRRNINDAWKTAYHYLGKNESRPLDDDAFLKAHLWFYYHKILSSELPTSDDLEMSRYWSKSMHIIENSPEFLLNVLFSRKRLIDGNGNGDGWVIDIKFLHDYISHLKKTAELYFQLSTPESTSFSDDEKISLERIGRLQGFAVNPLILAIYLEEKSQKKRVIFLDTYERLMFCLSIKHGARALRAYQHNLEWVKRIKGIITTDVVIQFMENLLTELFKEQSVADMLNDWMKAGLGYYGWRSINYFLYEYELELQSLSKTNRAKISWSEFAKEDFREDYMTVEHIYPQKARATYWQEKFGNFKISEKRSLRNSLGNLLALSRPKNSSLGNKAFPDKVGRPSDTVGYRYGGYSENEVAACVDWDANEITKRGLKMLTFFEKRWQIDLGDLNQKYKALGLQFMQK